LHFDLDQDRRRDLPKIYNQKASSQMGSPFLYLPLDLPLFLVLVAFGAAQE